MFEEKNIGNSIDIKTAINITISNYVSKEMCKYIAMESIVKIFKDTFEEFTDEHKNKIKLKYLKFMGIKKEMISLIE